MPDITLQTINSFVNMQVSNRGVAELFPNVRLLNQNSPNATGVVQVGQLLSDVAVSPSEGPPGVPSIPEFVGLDYVGYVVEKDRLDKSTGEWIRIDEYRIIGAASNGFKDSRVAYGNCYRYRIKSIIKVTSKIVKTVSELNDLKQDFREYQAEEIKSALEAQQGIISSVEQITNLGLSPHSSLGQKKTVFDLFEGFSVEADSARTALVSSPVSSTNKIIQSFTNTSNLAVSSLGLMQGTIGSSELQKFVDTWTPQVEKKEEYFSFYYESLPSKKWLYVDVSETLPPPPPSSIKIIPNSRTRSIMVSWLSPANIQRDNKKFRLYRRERVGQRWILMKEFDLGENFFIDRRVRFFHTYIYALTTIDAHGIESRLSMQTQAELNPNYNSELVERPLKWISGSGADPRDGFDEVFKKFFEPDVPIIAERNVVIGPTRVFKEGERKLIVRLKSLDIHDCKEFVVTLKNLKVK